MVIELIISDDSTARKKKLWTLVRALAGTEIGAVSDKEYEKVVGEIHELCYEHSIHLQANELYAEFPYKSLVKKLVEDHVEMEHCRRRDDFDRYCLALYQQLENMVCYTVDHYNLWEEAKNKKHDPINAGFQVKDLFLYSKKGKVAENERKKNSDYFDREAGDLKMKDKFKLFLYFIYFNGKAGSKGIFDRVFYQMWGVYLVRNRTHRTAVKEQYTIDQLNQIDLVHAQKYLQYGGFLADCIERVHVHFNHWNR